MTAVTYGDDLQSSPSPATDPNLVPGNGVLLLALQPLDPNADILGEWPIGLRVIVETVDVPDASAPVERPKAGPAFFVDKSADL